jgi:ATP-dependent Zn protease
MTDDRYPRATAYHEAGHAVVAWSLGLEVAAIWVSDDDASGGMDPAEPDQVDRLPLVDQLAVCYGGEAAENIFGHHITHDQAWWGDQGKVIELLIANGISPENGDGRASALRDQGYDRASSLVEARKSEVVAVAEHLVKHGRMEENEVRRLLPPYP